MPTELLPEFISDLNRLHSVPSNQAFCKIALGLFVLKWNGEKTKDALLSFMKEYGSKHKLGWSLPTLLLLICLHWVMLIYI
jgi:hypothetical protein